jgi:hypothetical protein
MSSGRNAMFVFIIMWVMFMSGSFNSGVEAKTHPVLVSIRNDLTTNLTVGCHSSEDGIGIRTLQTNQTYDFKFKPNFWGSTKFVCDFLWNFENKTVIHNNFLIYKYKRDHAFCGIHCLWGINQTNATQYVSEIYAPYYADRGYPW